MTNRKRIAALLLSVLSVLGLSMTAAPIAVADPQHHASVNCAEAPYVPPQGEPSAFATFPYAKQDAKHHLVITQGWEVSEDEEAFVGAGVHGALDFEFRGRADKGYGVPVRAVAAGCAVYSFQAFTLEYIDPQGQPHNIGGGAGLFVEIIHDNGWVSQYVHLDSVESKITYLRPEPGETEGEWVPSGIFRPTAQVKQEATRVEAGEIIGYNGDTGITLDYFDDFDVETGTVAPRDRNSKPNWENGDAQLHFTVYAYRNEAGSRVGTRDALDINGKITSVSDPYNKCVSRFFAGSHPVLQLKRNGEPVYARK